MPFSTTTASTSSLRCTCTSRTTSASRSSSRAARPMCSRRWPMRSRAPAACSSATSRPGCRRGRRVTARRRPRAALESPGACSLPGPPAPSVARSAQRCLRGETPWSHRTQGQRAGRDEVARSLPIMGDLTLPGVIERIAARALRDGSVDDWCWRSARSSPRPSANCRAIRSAPRCRACRGSHSARQRAARLACCR